MSKPNAIRTEDKDLPLRDDIRLLGRILGDTVREQSGEAVFDTVEHIRQNSVSFCRNEDVTARGELEATLNSLPPTEALQIIRKHAVSGPAQAAARVASSGCQFQGRSSAMRRAG